MIKERMTLADKINAIVNHVKTSAKQNDEKLPVEAQALLSATGANLIEYRVATTSIQKEILIEIADSIRKYKERYGITNEIGKQFATLGAGINAVELEIRNSMYLFPEPELSDFEKMLNDRLENGESVDIYALQEQILTMYRGNTLPAFEYLMNFLKDVHKDLKAVDQQRINGEPG